MFFLICFDISDNKIRYRVVKALKGHGVRVQKSVFECPDMTEKGFLKLKRRLEGLIDETTDTIRYYRLCRSCIKEVEYSGTGTRPKDEDFWIA